MLSLGVYIKAIYPLITHGYSSKTTKRMNLKFEIVILLMLCIMCNKKGYSEILNFKEVNTIVYILLSNR